jgi:hypothetical protein
MRTDEPLRSSLTDVVVSVLNAKSIGLTLEERIALHPCDGSDRI